jgi:hypothetical protein
MRKAMAADKNFMVDVVADEIVDLYITTIL